jgi:Xaa-Pro aminopeptidase
VEHDCDVDFVEVHANRDGALLFAPNDYEIRVGESFVVDIGARYLNYASDMAHNYCIGEPDALTARVHEAGLAAFNAVVNAASVGIIARDLYAIGTKALADRGFDPTYHMMGHGLGRHVHERPVLGPGDDSKLHAGEIIAVEVPMYLPGSCWVQIEENFVVNDSGLRWLEPWNLDICVL